MGRQRYEEAIGAWEGVLSLESGDAAAGKGIEEARRLLREQQVKEERERRSRDQRQREEAGRMRRRMAVLAAVGATLIVMLIVWGLAASRGKPVSGPRGETSVAPLEAAGEARAPARDASPGASSPKPEATPARAQASTSPPRTAQKGQIWASPTDGKEMVYVPAGEFVMGSREGEGYSEEHPQRRVYLDGYWMDKTEVTVGEYRRFCGATGRSMPKAPKWGWQESHPMVNVSWNEASAYAQWAGKRLPTEAEWEKAARGADGRKYPWGNQEPGSSRCNLDGRGDGHEYTAPVGSFPSGSSPYGCMDMAGNVWEWCADWYDPNYYKNGPTRNPKGPNSGESRVVRGGSWYYYSRLVRCAYRFSSRPPFRSYDFLGFRCARDS